MHLTAPRQSFEWLLGRDRYQRLYMQFWAMTSSAYLLITAFLYFYAVSDAMLSQAAACIVVAAILTVVFAFFVAMRSGWSKRFKDPALTDAQMAFALVMVLVVYVLAPRLRGSVLLFPPLILLFGAFSLAPRRCKQMGGLAVLLHCLMVGLSIARNADGTNAQTEFFNLCVGTFVNVLVAVFSARLSAMRHQLRIQKKQLNQALEANLALVRQDSLTSLPNRRYAEELLQTEASRALRQPVSTCVCMIDIDHFKSINDTHGHAAGDQVLCLFAQCSSAMLRTIDVLARWGGEEFMLLMPLTKVDEAIKVLERMHSRFAQPEVWQSHPELKVTFSAGIAIHLAGEPISATLARADAAMYQAKLQGRNRTNHAA